MKTKLLICSLIVILCSACTKQAYNMADYGLKPNTGENASPLFTQALQDILNACQEDTIHIVLEKGRYDFHVDGSAIREYYISNHDQDNPKSVGLAFENVKNIVFDGQGSELIFHGRMLPISLIDAENCTLKNFSIDFENPHISQVKVLENDTINRLITYEIAPWVQYEVRDSSLVSKGEGWEHVSTYGIAFEGDTKRLVYRTSDIRVGTKHIEQIGERTFRAPWKNNRLVPGTVVALRCPGRPCPALFMYHDKNTTLQNIHVHYAEGMGVLAQVCENIYMDDFSVCLRGDDDPRYFTAQADATHFSGCKGIISCVNGLYEGMMDDAINVHGVYLRIQQRLDDRTVIAENLQPGSYGFEWGRKGDIVQFIQSKTMEVYGDENRIAAIEPVDTPTDHGAHSFKITFEKDLDAVITPEGSFGIENMEWTPEVYFAHNTVRNNRARGALFSTPKKTIVEDNLFDHTSGAAILLCGDCNGWYETGACHDVVIRNNKFINSLTNMFQFTNAVISIYPEIPDLEHQQKYFHSGIVIEDNLFETFDQPILYAKSVDGLVFRHNTIKQNTEYPAFHWNKRRIFFQRIIHSTIEDNKFDGGFNKEKDVLEQ